MATATADGGTGTGQHHSPRRLYRRTDERMIAGIASGLGDYFNIDPILFRIGFILLAFAGGASVFLYLALWWFVPPTEEVSGRGEDAVRRLKTAPTWVAMVLLIVGAGLLLDQLDVTSSQIIWGLALIGLGVLLFRHATGRPIPGISLGPPPPPPAPAASPPAPPSPGPALAPSPLESPPVPPPWTSTARWSPPRRPRRERSGLGWATLGLALIAGGVAAMLDNAGVLDLSLSQYLAIGLAVLGIGMLVGSWWGRARWLIIPALLLTPAVLVGSLVNVPFRGGFGDRLYMPRSSSGLDVTHNLIAGKIRLDLTHLASDGLPVKLAATLVAGDLDVIVPRGVHVTVHARVGAGSMDLFPFRVYADGVSVERLVSKGPEGGRDIQLDLAVSFGRIQIIRG